MKWTKIRGPSSGTPRASRGVSGGGPGGLVEMRMGGREGLAKITETEHKSTLDTMNWGWLVSRNVKLDWLKRK